MVSSYADIVVTGTSTGTQTNTTVETIEASTATESIFKEGKTIALHGTIITKEVEHTSNSAMVL